ncbi:MAG: hypothetical protein DRP58_03375 [Spirochaetes bacterium]|nr:MAG: hypothetical protein DRP58_03375 [Spirochaetota bacterium]
MPVIFVGKVNSPDDVKYLESEYSADYIAVGRALVADSEFIGKIEGKVKGLFRPCLECSQGCLGGVKRGKGLQCLVDPTVGKIEPRQVEAEGAKSFAVVGGGLSGMEAAVSLREKGYNVDLYEMGELGGQFVLASLTPNKQSMGRLIPYYTAKLSNSGVRLIKSEAKPEDLLSGYDSVVLATGAKDSIPSIPGLVNYRTSDILLDSELPTGKKVLIIGGGLTGVDIATALITRNNQVIIVKRTTDFGQDMEMISKKLSLKMMKEKNVVFSDYTRIKKIEGSTVYALRNEEDITFSDIDLIIVSTGMKSNNPLQEVLENKVPVYVIGDADKIGDAQDAIADAYFTAAGL